MRARRVNEKGATAVVAAVVLFAVGAFMALALNVGLIMTSRGQLQNASDSAALAAAGSIDGSWGGLHRAEAMAVSYSQVHNVTGEAVQIDPYTQDVLFGRWHFKAEGGWPARSFEVLYPIDPFMTNAVMVTNGRDTTGRHNSPLDVVFGIFLGTNQANVVSSAVAVSRGARSDDCPLPFILPSCSLQDGSGWKCDEDVTLILTSDGIDNIGFVFMLEDTTGVGNPTVYDNIIRRCEVEADAGLYDVQNGNDMNDTVIKGLLGVADHGANIEPIPPLNPDGSSSLCVFNPGYTAMPIGNTTCPNPKFSGDLTIAQYAEVAIKSATDNNGHIYDQTSCPKAPVKWQDYQAALQIDANAGPRMVVNVKCGSGNGLGFNSGVVLRLVQ